MTAELIAGEGEDGEALVLVIGEQSTQTCVLRGKPSTAGDVDHQGDDALIIGKLHDVCEDRRQRAERLSDLHLPQRQRPR
ncbi:MAG: hypothetical protein AAFV53_28395, partial [Myxococcota bacterium]